MSGPLAALTMGELVVHSRPGKPLRASIPVTLHGEEQLAELHVTLAPDESYAGQQTEGPALTEGMSIGLLATGEHSARIQLFGKQPWQGDEVVLVLYAVWPNGDFSRRYRLAGVHLDEGDEDQAYQFVEVAANETLDEIAMRLSVETNRSYLHMMYALFLANPEAFYRGNMNNLKRGARLRVPPVADLYQLKDAEVFRAIRQQYEEWRSQQEASAAVPTQAGAMLSEMDDAQTATLDLQGEPHELQQHLQRLSKDNEAIQRRNAELKARLARLEQQIQQVSEEVLDYQPPAQPAADEQQSVAPPAPGVKEAQPESAPELSKNSEPVASRGLPGYIMFMVMMLALGSGLLVWRYTAGRQDRAD